MKIIKLMVTMIVSSLSFLTVPMAEEPTLGLKNFRSLYYSLQVATGVKPTKEIRDFFQSNMSRLPKDGRPDEMSSPMLLASKALAGLFCKEFSRSQAGLQNQSFDSLTKVLSNQFYNRDLTSIESTSLMKLKGELQPTRDSVFIVCVAMTSSIEFLVQK